MLAWIFQNDLLLFYQYLFFYVFFFFKKKTHLLPVTGLRWTVSFSVDFFYFTFGNTLVCITRKQMTTWSAAHTLLPTSILFYSFNFDLFNVLSKDMFILNKVIVDESKLSKKLTKMYFNTKLLNDDILFNLHYSKIILSING